MLISGITGSTGGDGGSAAGVDGGRAETVAGRFRLRGKRRLWVGFRNRRIGGVLPQSVLPEGLCPRPCCRR